MIVTRDALLSLAKFKPARDLRRSLRVIREAHDATNSKGQPDHMVRLAAADRVLDLADVRKPRNDGADPSRPVSVNIILGDTRQLAGQAQEGYVLRLSTPQLVEGEVIERKPASRDADGQAQLPGIVGQ